MANVDQNHIWCRCSNLGNSLRVETDRIYDNDPFAVTQAQGEAFTHQPNRTCDSNSDLTGGHNLITRSGACCQLPVVLRAMYWLKVWPL